MTRADTGATVPLGEETAAYLGYPIRIRNGHLTVTTPAGFIIVAGRIEMSTARRIIRQHRSETRHL